MGYERSVMSLLAPDEKPAVEVYNAAGRARLLFVCDHASRAVPRALGDLGVPAAEFDRHIAWDIGAADVARRLAGAFDAKLVLSGYSRLVIDLNRDPRKPTAIPEISDGTPVPGNRGLDADQRRLRVDTLFKPYHAAIAAALDSIRKTGIAPIVVSVHSCTPVFEGFERPWHIGVLWNTDGRLAQPLMAQLAKADGVLVGDNQPYSARDGHGYTMPHHCEAARLPHALLEIRQDLIDTHKGAERWAGVVARGLAPLLNDSALR
jgi:predicted N-formylglutamate amidohydrolase